MCAGGLLDLNFDDVAALQEGVIAAVERAAISSGYQLSQTRSARGEDAKLTASSVRFSPGKLDHFGPLLGVFCNEGRIIGW